MYSCRSQVDRTTPPGNKRKACCPHRTRRWRRKNTIEHLRTCAVGLGHVRVPRLERGVGMHMRPMSPTLAIACTDVREMLMERPRSVHSRRYLPILWPWCEPLVEMRLMRLVDYCSLSLLAAFHRPGLWRDLVTSQSLEISVLISFQARVCPCEVVAGCLSICFGDCHCMPAPGTESPHAMLCTFDRSPHYTLRGAFRLPLLPSIRHLYTAAFAVSIFIMLRPHHSCDS